MEKKKIVSREYITEKMNAGEDVTKDMVAIEDILESKISVNGFRKSIILDPNKEYELQIECNACNVYVEGTNSDKFQIHTENATSCHNRHIEL